MGPVILALLETAKAPNVSEVEVCTKEFVTESWAPVDSDLFKGHKNYKIKITGNGLIPTHD